MYSVFPKIAAEDPTVWIVLPTLIVAVVAALFILGVFLGYFHRNASASSSSIGRKTRDQYKDALSFERGERIRLERELYQKKKDLINLKDQIAKKGTANTEQNERQQEERLQEIERENERLVQSHDRLRNDLTMRKERIADLLTEIAIAQSEVDEAHLELERLKRSVEPQRQILEVVSKEATLKEILTKVAALEGIHLALVADDYGLVVESSEPGAPAEKLAAVSSLIAREGQKIKDLYDIGNIESIALGDDQGLFVDNTYFQLFNLRCALSIIRDKSHTYPGLAEQTIEAIVSRLQE